MDTVSPVIPEYFLHKEYPWAKEGEPSCNAAFPSWYTGYHAEGRCELKDKHEGFDHTIHVKDGTIEGELLLWVETVYFDAPRKVSRGISA